MEDWLTTSLQTLDRLATTVETQIITFVDQTLDATDEALEQFSDQISQQLDQLSETVPPVWAKQVEEQLETWSASLENLPFQAESLLEEALRPVNQTLTPLVNEHPVCVGCRNYNGSTYNETMLVCAVHPYGCEGDRCPDWESTWDNTPWNNG